MKLFCFSFLFFVASLLPAQKNLFDYEHTKKYAVHLYSVHAFEEASTEYERLYFFNPKEDSTIYWLTNAYMYAGLFERGIRFFEKETLLSKQPFSYYYAKLLVLNESFDKMDSLEDIPLHPELQLARMMLNSKWEQAQALLEENDTSRIKNALYFTEQLNRATGFRKKQPFVAAGLSAIVPGTGKFYTGNFKDGFVSLFMVGITGFLAYRGFSQKGLESIPGWIYGGIGTGFYIGNIYGSATSAKHYNTRFYERVHKDVKNILIYH